MDAVNKPNLRLHLLPSSREYATAEWNFVTCDSPAHWMMQLATFLADLRL